MNSQPSEKQHPHFSNRDVSLIAALFLVDWVIVTGTLMLPALFPSLSVYFDEPVETITLASSVLAFTGLLAPLFGPWIDRYGYRIFLLGGLVVFSLGNLASTVSRLFWLFLVCIAVIGISRSVLDVVITSFIGDAFDYELRGRVMGTVRVAISLALIIGVPAATFITDIFSIKGAFWGLALWTILVLILISVLINNRPTRVNGTASPQASFHMESYLSILKQKEALISLATSFLWSFIPTGVLLYLADWLQRSYSFSETRVGLAFSFIGIGSLAGNSLSAFFADRLGKKRVVLIGLFLMAMVTVVLTLPGAAWLTFAFLFLFAAGLDLSSSAFFTLVTEINSQFRATLLSLTTFAIGVATGLTPILMRPLWRAGGYQLITLVCSFLGFCVVLMISLFIREQETIKSVS